MVGVQDLITDLHLVPAPLDLKRVATARRAALQAQALQPPDQQPGLLRSMLGTVETAKQAVAAERQQQEQQRGEQTGDAGGNGGDDQVG